MILNDPVGNSVRLPDLREAAEEENGSSAAAAKGR